MRACVCIYLVWYGPTEGFKDWKDLKKLDHLEGEDGTSKYLKIPRSTSKYLKYPKVPQSTSKYLKIPRTTSKYP